MTDAPTASAPPPPPPGSPYAAPAQPAPADPGAYAAPRQPAPTQPAPPGQAAYEPTAHAQPTYPQSAYDPAAYAQPATVATPPAMPSTRVSVARLAQVLALITMLIGLSLPFDRTLWASATAWAVFAAVAAVLQLSPFLGPSMGLSTERAWTIGAAATAAIGVFWVLVAAPAAASNEGFFLTASALCAAVGTWWSPGNRW